jgi:hypothetical protein
MVLAQFSILLVLLDRTDMLRRCGVTKYEKIELTIDDLVQTSHINLFHLLSSI